MNLLLVGISHKTSPLEVRELFAISAERIQEALGALREHALEATDRIIAEETTLYQQREKQLQVVPTIVSLQRHLEDIRRAELARARHSLGSLTPEQEKALEALTRSLINKILHTPFTELKHAASRPDRSEFLEVVRTIFHLEDDARAEAARAVN